jgi:hypothetical protein
MESLSKADKAKHMHISRMHMGIGISIMVIWTVLFMVALLLNKINVPQRSVS